MLLGSWMYAEICLRAISDGSWGVIKKALLVISVLCSVRVVNLVIGYMRYAQIALSSYFSCDEALPPLSQRLRRRKRKRSAVVHGRLLSRISSLHDDNDDSPSTGCPTPRFDIAPWGHRLRLPIAVLNICSTSSSPSSVTYFLVVKDYDMRASIGVILLYASMIPSFNTQKCEPITIPLCKGFSLFVISFH